MSLLQKVDAMRASVLRRSAVFPRALAIRVLKWVVIAVTTSLVVSYVARRFGACHLTIQLDPINHQKVTWCWDFWLQRYQGLLSFFLAFGAAIIAYRQQTAEQRDKRYNQRAEARRFMRRLLKQDEKIREALSTILEVDAHLIQHTHETIARQEAYGLQRFDWKYNNGRHALAGLEANIDALAALVFDVRDEQLESHLQSYARWLKPTIQKSNWLLTEARQQVHDAPPPPDFQRSLPSLQTDLAPARDARDKVLKRCSELAGETSWSETPTDLWP